MAMPEGTKKWGTLATWSDADAYDYFRNVRAQDPDHAINSLRLLRSQWDADGSRRANVIPKAEVELDANVVGRARADGATRGVERVKTREDSEELRAVREALHELREMDEKDPHETIREEDARDRASAEERLDKVLKEQRAARFKANANGEIVGQRDAAGEALAKLVAPWLGDVLAHVINAEVEQMHAHLSQHQPTKLVVVDKGEERPLDGTHHKAAPKVIGLAAQGLNVMLVGPAGSGKTMLGRSVAQALDGRLTCISCSAGMSEAQLLGRLLPLGEGGSFAYVESPFVKAYREGGVILLDEMDAADANLLLVINAALANGEVDIEARAASGLDTCVKRHEKTVIIAAANTWGAGADTQYIGRGALDVSTLDRFYRIGVDYDEALEHKIGQPETVEFVHRLRRKVRDCKLRRVVSTRMITRIDKARAGGVSFSEAKRDELASWTKDERAKVGEG